MKKLKIMECFGGIGACSKALERLGIDYEIADYVEIDKYAVKSFNAMHGTNFEPQDITIWNKDIDVDLIMHGSPCQDFSLSGLQAGGDEGSGTRSSLMYETIRIVEKLKPKYVIWENVKNLLSKKHVHNFNNYLDKMKELGYSNYYQVLNAKDYGIPQNRERVFTVSIRYDQIIEMGSYQFPQKQELKLKLKDMLEDNVDEKYYLTSNMIEYLENGKYNSSKVSNKLKRTEKGICPTLDTMQGGNRQPFIKINNELRIRKLTPREVWRLMGFDDGDFDKASKVNSNTQLYKQAGNSIVVNVLEAILTNLLLDKNNEIKGQLSIYDFLKNIY